MNERITRQQSRKNEILSKEDVAIKLHALDRGIALCQHCILQIENTTHIVVQESWMSGFEGALCEAKTTLAELLVSQKLDGWNTKVSSTLITEINKRVLALLEVLADYANLNL